MRTAIFLGAILISESISSIGRVIDYSYYPHFNKLLLIVLVSCICFDIIEFATNTGRD